MLINNQNKLFKILGNYVFIPKLITNLLRTQDELNALPEDTRNRGFDNINTTIILINKKLNLLKNSINDNKIAIDRNSNIIDTKNNKISFLAYSESFPENGATNEFLNKSITISTKEVEGIIADEDSGIEINEIQEDDKNFIKFNFDDSKLKGIKFISASNSSIRIVWNESMQGYVIEQNDILLYQSAAPEMEIIIDHNLGTKAIDVKTFKFLQNDIDLKYPIIPGIEYPSDNQVRLYLTEPRMVQVLISRL